MNLEHLCLMRHGTVRHVVLQPAHGKIPQVELSTALPTLWHKRRRGNPAGLVAPRSHIGAVGRITPVFFCVLIFSAPLLCRISIIRFDS